MRCFFVSQSYVLGMILSIGSIITPFTVYEVRALSFVGDGKCFCNQENEKVCLVEYHLPSQNNDPLPPVTLWIPFGPCDKGVSAPPAPRIDIRADGNRDGMVSVSPGSSDPDEQSEAKWTFQRGAIVLPNLDNDGERGGFKEYACDADDDIINGPDDLDDLALIRILPLDPAIEESFISLEGLIEAPLDRVNVFYRSKGDSSFKKWQADNEPLTMDQLISGVELRIESKKVAETMEDRFISVSVRMNSLDYLGYYHESSDTVQLRVAPIMFHHHLDDAEQLLISPVEDDDIAHAFEDFTNKMSAAATEIGIPLVAWPVRSSNGTKVVRWMQDIAEWGYAVAPRVGGGIQRMRFILLNDVQQAPGAFFGIRTHGPNIALIAIGDDSADERYGTLEAAGNFEVIPPLSNRSFGNVIRGSASLSDKMVTSFLRAQELQPEFSVDIDTKWLRVGHIDELFSFLPAPNSKNGWKLLYADPRLALELLKQAPTDFDTFIVYEQNSVRKFLEDYQNDPRLIDQAITEAEGALASLVTQAGLNPSSDVIRVPVIFGLRESNVGNRVENISGNIVNGALIGQGARQKFLAPKPWGPSNGLSETSRDLFAEYASRVIKRETGIEVTWIDTFFAYHIYSGGVHCASNVIRKIPDQPWWSTTNTKVRVKKRRTSSSEKSILRTRASKQRAAKKK